MPTPKLLPALAPVSRLSYVGSQILGALGPSETPLTDRAVKRIHKALPVPAEQEILWADVAFGTRPHGLVLTDAGIFFKDGPGDDEDEDEDEDEDARDPDDQPQSLDGVGYHYLRWGNFDPALVSHVDGHPTIGGERFRDRERFFAIAAACVPISNRRVRMCRAGKKAAAGVVDPRGPLRTRWRPSVKETFQSCLDDEGFWGPVTEDDIPLRVTVPADQYDAVLQRVRKKVAEGWAPPLEDPDAAAVLVRKSRFTYLQGANLAKTARIPGVAYNPTTGAVTCKDSRGLDAVLDGWLATRRCLGTSAPHTAGVPATKAANAIATGAASAANASQVAQAQAANFIVDNAASTAGRTVGAAGARVLTAAMGITFAPLALAASFALGDVCGKAGSQAVTMAKDLFFEPEAQVYGRLLDGILQNVIFEYALTEAEQTTLAQLMAKVDPQVFQRLGAALRESTSQEQQVRALAVPLCETVRRL